MALLASLIKDVHKEMQEETGKKKITELNAQIRTVAADLTVQLEGGLSHQQLVAASARSRLMFRFSPPAEFLRGGLTAQIVHERIAASVHEHMIWMEKEPSLELKTSVAYCIAAFERAWYIFAFNICLIMLLVCWCSFRCLRQRSFGLFTFPAMGVLIRLNPSFGCNLCGATKVPEKDQHLCSKCEIFMHCSKCVGIHTVNE